MIQHDVVFEVGHPNDDNNVVSVMAFRQVMTNASVVFAAMLDEDKFLEGQQLRDSGKVNIALPDDDPAAMAAICDIVHMRTPQIVDSMDSTLLWEMSKLVQKYDFTRAIQPWPAFWAAKQPVWDLLDHALESSLHEVVKWVHVCSNFGFATTFNKLTSTLIRHVSDGDLHDDSFTQAWEAVSPELRDKILEVREKYVDGCRQLSIKLLNDKRPGNTCKVFATSPTLSEPSTEDFDVSSLEGFHCSSMQYGNAYLALRSEFGTHWKSRESWSGSIEQLHRRLNRVSRHLTGTAGLHEKFRQRRTSSHGACGSSEWLTTEVQHLYDMAAKGLDFFENGNDFYRASGSIFVADCQEHTVELQP